MDIKLIHLNVSFKFYGQTVQYILKSVSHPEQIHVKSICICYSELLTLKCMATNNENLQRWKIHEKRSEPTRISGITMNYSYLIRRKFAKWLWLTNHWNCLSFLPMMKYYESSLCRSGVVTKLISFILLFIFFDRIIKRLVTYKVNIWQVSPQLCCGDICQIRMWLRGSNRYFGKIRNILNGEINERGFINPHS